MSINKKKILQVNIDNNGGNGAFSVMRYLYTYLSDEYVFDYFTMGTFLKDKVYEDIYEKGGICYSANLRKNKISGHIVLPFVFYNFIKKNKYEIVHIHSEVAYKQFLYTVAARCAKVRKIIIHSHSCDIDGKCKSLKYMLHILFRNAVNKLGTDFLACSMPAAEWMFTSKNLKSENFKLLHNGINPSLYKYSTEIRKTVRTFLNIENKKVIGHVGALKKVKNQERLLDIISEIKKDDYILMLIGDGDDYDKLLQLVKENNIENKVLFLGNRIDVSDLMQAMDVFVFPSLFEGIPMALIEAQTVGLPIVASDVINRDVKINNNVHFLSLKENNNIWISEIEDALNEHLKEDGYNRVCLSEYNIKNSAETLRKVYLDA